MASVFPSAFEDDGRFCVNGQKIYKTMTSCLGSFVTESLRLWELQSRSRNISIQRKSEMFGEQLNLKFHGGWSWYSFLDQEN
jgi:hypothetical protein